MQSHFKSRALGHDLATGSCFSNRASVRVHRIVPLCLLRGLVANMFSAPPSGDDALSPQQGASASPALEAFEEAVAKVLRGYWNLLALGNMDFLVAVEDHMGITDRSLVDRHAEDRLRGQLMAVASALPLAKRLEAWQACELAAVLKLNGLKHSGSRAEQIVQICSSVKHGALPKCPTCTRVYLRWSADGGSMKAVCPGFYAGRELGMVACVGPQEVVVGTTFQWGENGKVKQTRGASVCSDRLSSSSAAGSRTAAAASPSPNIATLSRPEAPACRARSSAAHSQSAARADRSCSTGMGVGEPISANWSWSYPQSR